MFKVLDEHVMPAYKDAPIDLLFQCVPQPWRVLTAPLERPRENERDARARASERLRERDNAQHMGGVQRAHARARDTCVALDPPTNNSSSTKETVSARVSRHPQSSLMHEVALAVKAVDESKFFPAARLLLAAQAQFFDDRVMDKTRSQLYSELVAVVSQAGVDEAALHRQLALTGAGNSGNAVTIHVKFATKYHRARSIHVTPTVLLNGIEAPDISSGWTPEQWREKLDPILAVGSP